MRKKRRTTFISVMCLVALLCVGLTSGVTTTSPQQVLANETEIELPALPQPDNTASFRLEPFYLDVWKQWQQEGVPAGGATSFVPADQLSAQAEEAQLQIGSYGGKDNVVLWTNQRGWIEYELEVAQAGLYELALDYFPLPRSEGGGRTAVQFSVQLNGAFPFREARALDFYRAFKDVWPLRQDQLGNDLRPQLEELTGWKTQKFRDSDGAYVLPLLWRLNAGVNTVRLQIESEPVAIAGIHILPPSSLQAYEAYASQYPAANVTGSGSDASHLITIDAQQMDSKNETSLQVQSERDPLATPLSYQNIRYNTMGGWSWANRSQAATWEFEVPEAGYYKIALRGYQGFRQNLTTHRNIYINGEIPFERLAGYPFAYANQWQGFTLEDEDGDVLTFYLDEGPNTLTLEATHEPYMEIISTIDVLSDEIRSIAIDIRNAKGGRVDPLRRWRVEEELPGLTDRLRVLKTYMDYISASMERINGKRDDVSRSFDESSKDLEALLRKPNEIPFRETEIGSLQERIEGQRAILMSKPLQIDKIYIASPERELPKMRANFFQKARGTALGFYHSFFNEDSLRSTREDELNVWFMLGRDYVNELQALADQYFTPEHGVRVKVNLVQQPELLILSNAAGIMPDVALGVPGEMPYDLALRGAALNLSELPGAEEVFAQFSPGALMPFAHNNGYYGIPETMQFKVLFYRTDILEQLGLEVPNTWDDVYDMIPTLVQNNYNFYMEPRDFSFLFYQNGVDFYSPDGGATGLNTPEGFEAFKIWTDFFNIYGLERQVQSFYNQFRRGYLPIGIADFNQYMQILIAAPELRGFWGIAPLPGVEQEDGTIVRWSGGIPDISGAGMSSANIAGSSMTSVVLFENADEEMRDHAWEFAKWYTSAEIQAEFGTNLEQYFGEQFRWNTANVAAFTQLPWRREELDIILEQWKWFKDFPNTPGSYMTGREINFAWIRTVLEGENYRTSLEKAIRNINRELQRKQQEFDLLDESGQLRSAIPLITLDEPWTGVDAFAR